MSNTNNEFDEYTVVVYGAGFEPRPQDTTIPGITITEYKSPQWELCIRKNHEKIVALRALSETWKSVLKKDAKHAKALLEQIIKIIDG